MYSLAQMAMKKDGRNEGDDEVELFRRAATAGNRDGLPERFYIDGVMRAFNGIDV